MREQRIDFACRRARFGFGGFFKFNPADASVSGGHSRDWETGREAGEEGAKRNYYRAMSSRRNQGIIEY